MFLFLAAFGTSDAQQSVAEALRQPGAKQLRAADRALVVEKIAGLENSRRQRAQAKGKLLGLPLRRVLANGRIHELADFDGPQPLYLGTDNTAAAISTGAKMLQTSPYSLSGSGVTIGLWDGGAARASHQEFGTRVTIKDGSTTADHATHVGGTLAAAGIHSSARGMATAATIDSYDWNNDVSELTARGATAPGQADRLYLSNHSYNYLSGWTYINGGSPSRVWEWHGSGTSATSVETDFGAYNTLARDQDIIAHQAPYLLVFRSAGNDRNNNPAIGQMVSLSPGGGTVVPYNPSIHPAGDGSYLGGFGTIGFSALSKNVITVGSTLDAVSSSVRDASRASLSVFTAWGPTDDGRIKPDVVANGHELYSPTAVSNNSYATYSGTSMASPNACGSAALLIQHYSSLFPGKAMRASTLKSLILHTADDRGNPGPDYKYGWGLMNAQSAADHIRDHAAAPLKQNIIEGQISSTLNSRVHRMVWDGVSPIKATLGWTDPVGPSIEVSDSRTATLVNNLNLKIIGPDGSQHLPYVMPFVGTWTQASMNATAVNGINHTDNTEQILIAQPPVAGVYEIQVTFSGALADNSQAYSLILSGAANEEAPLPPVALSGVAPATGLSMGVTNLEISGSYLETATGIRLTRSGQTDIFATGIQMVAGKLRCQVDLTGAAAGTWNVVADRAGSSPAMLAGAFEVLGALMNETFDDSSVGWTSVSSFGSNAWSLTTGLSHSPSKSWMIPAPSARTTTHLVSPAVVIPPGASNLQLRFYHNYNFQSRIDGGRLEFSLNGGNWFDVESANSGADLVAGDYTDYIRSTSGSQFKGLGAWTHNSNGWVESVVNLSSPAFAGTSVRIRWSLATDNSIASSNWYLDSVRLFATVPPPNQAPVFATSPFASSGETQTDPDSSIHHVVRGVSTTLDLTAADDGGESALTYAWSVVAGPAALVLSSANAKSTEAHFTASGDYQVLATVTDAQGLSVSAPLHLRVLPTPTSLAVSPAVAEVQVGQQLALGAIVQDQFGASIPEAISACQWAASGGGSISTSGIYQATAAGGPYEIRAESGPLADTASITVTASSSTGGTSQDAEDPDGDGLSNLAEYALGTQPGTFTPPMVPIKDASGLYFLFTRPASIQDITYIAESCDGHGEWTPALLELVSDGEIQTWRARDPLTSGNPSARFLRLRFVRD
ncbi:MAG: S8 family serine peptidase [Akkermansiaceae bacterium]|nr:S8 family serine peptidase [Akkermansiaceae bacterium]